MLHAIWKTVWQVKNWKAPHPRKCSTDEWQINVVYIPTMDYYAALKGNRVLIHDTRMNLKNKYKMQTQKVT